MAQTIFKVVKDNIAAQLDDGIDDVDTVVVLRTGQGSQFPSTPFYCSCDFEVMICTAVIGDTLLVVRGADSTSPVGHSEGAIVELRANAGLWLDAYAAINALENGDNPAGKVANGSITDTQVANTAGISTFKLNPWPFHNNDLLGYPWGNDDLASSVWRYNYLVNGSFKIAQRFPTPNSPVTLSANNQYTADRWQIVINGTATISTFTRSTSSTSSYSDSAGLYGTVAGSDAGLVNFAGIYQKVEDFAALRGKRVTCCFEVAGAIAGVPLVFWWWDGVNPVSRVLTSVTTVAFTRYTFSFDVPTNATTVYVGFYIGNIAQFAVDNCQLVIGNQAPDFRELVYAEELARCLRYCEVSAIAASDSVIGSGQCTSTTNFIVPWIFKSRKGGVPTVSIFTPTALGVTNAAGTQVFVATLNSDLLGPSGCRLAGSVASGLTANASTVLFHTGNPNSMVLAEWNP